MSINFNTQIFEAYGYVTKTGLPASPRVCLSETTQEKAELSFSTFHIHKSYQICQNIPIVVEIGQHTA